MAIDPEERESDRLIAASGGFGKEQGVYTETEFRKQGEGIRSLEDLGEQSVGPVQSGEPLARLIRCLLHVTFTDNEASVLEAMRDLYTGPRRPVFRAVARRARCSVSTAFAAWASGAAKIVDWAEAHPTSPDPRREMIELLVEVFGSYAVRLTGLFDF